ncbi:hypothetical protein [Hymenobacter gelipurpurascens]|nr:hypothetical protein [Hymenobacter gelipurpurascens]
MKAVVRVLLLVVSILIFDHASTWAQSTPPAEPSSSSSGEIAVMRVYEGRGSYGSRIVVAYENGKVDEEQFKDFKGEFSTSMTQKVQVAISKLYKAGYVLLQASGGGMSETNVYTNLVIIETFVFRKP